jgi:hypothetical protein
MRDELCTPSACGADSDVGWNVRSMLGASMASFKVGLDLVLLRCPWLRHTAAMMHPSGGNLNPHGVSNHLWKTMKNAYLYFESWC